MNERILQEAIELYFKKNAESLQSELIEVQRAYIIRMLKEQKEEWAMKTQEESDMLFAKITDLLKSVYK
jgi:hypothetical protein